VRKPEGRDSLRIAQRHTRDEGFAINAESKLSRYLSVTIFAS